MSPRPRLATAHEWGIPGAVPHSLRRGGWGAGWGDAASTAHNVQIGSSIATPVITGAVGASAASAAAAGGSAAILGMAPALALPIIGAALVGVTILVTELIKNSGCGQTCIQTSQWANQAADALQKNSDAYFALPVPRPLEAQLVALQNFDAIWAQLSQMCGDPQWGDAGKRCISDRQRGACTWKQNRSGGHPGEPAIGECWNWFNGYRDPIANDPNVGSSAAGALDSVFGNGSGGSLLPLLAIGGLLAVAAVL